MAQSRERTLLKSCLETTTAKVIGIGRVKGICSAAVSLLLLTLLMNISCVACARDHRKQTNLEARVGSHVVFNCYIDFPYDSPIPYVVHWSKDVSQVRVRQRVVESQPITSKIDARCVFVALASVNCIYT